MKRVIKGNAPERFLSYCRRGNSSYADLSRNHWEIKKELKEVLLEDQGYLCCYCGCRIELDSSIIEHLFCQSEYEQLQLKFENLLCSCKGGSDKRSQIPGYPIHCDAAKGNKSIPVTPMEPNCEERFTYDEEGYILGRDDEANLTIEILNLENGKLKNKRKSAIEYYKWVDDHNWEEEMEMLQSQDLTGMFKEYCHVLIQYIRLYKLGPGGTL